MFTSENVEQFAARLAEHRPPVIYSMTGTHSVEYMGSESGEVAVISVDLPMDVTLWNGTTGPIRSITIPLPEGDE